MESSVWKRLGNTGVLRNKVRLRVDRVASQRLRCVQDSRSYKIRRRETNAVLYLQLSNHISRTTRDTHLEIIIWMETECCCTGTREKNRDLQGGLSAKGPIAVIIQLSTCVNTGTGTARATARDAGAMPVLQCKSIIRFAR
jgi:hypothetical protein